MKCPSCNKEINDSADFCGYCGQQVNREHSDLLHETNVEVDEELTTEATAAKDLTEASQQDAAEASPQDNADKAVKANQDSGGKPSSSNTQPRKAKILIFVIAAVLVAAVVLFMTVLSPQARADRLYEDGSYAEALEIYTTLNETEEIKEKVADCRYCLFLDYLNISGSYTNGSEATSYTVKALSNGDIECSVSGSASTYGASIDSSYSITLHRGEDTVDFAGSNNMYILGHTTSVSGSGKFDKSSYSYGQAVALDDYDNSSTATNTAVKSNSKIVQNMIKKGLKGALEESGLDITLADLGFTNLG